jgi:hypothetical protein
VREKRGSKPDHKTGSCNRIDRRETSKARNLDRCKRVMGDDPMGVSKASSDIVGLKLGIVLPQGVFGHTLSEQSQL